MENIVAEGIPKLSDWMYNEQGGWIPGKDAKKGDAEAKAGSAGATLSVFCRQQGAPEDVPARSATPAPSPERAGEGPSWKGNDVRKFFGVPTTEGPAKEEPGSKEGAAMMEEP